MAEPTVQVPVSLIEGHAAFLDRAGYTATAEKMRALLSQPNPTAEAFTLRDLFSVGNIGGDVGRSRVALMVGYRWRREDDARFLAATSGDAFEAFERTLAGCERVASTAEPMRTCGVCGRNYPAADDRDTCPVCWPGFGEHTAAPPRIEDMAPGTTFWAALLSGFDPTGKMRLWLVSRGGGFGARVSSADNERWTDKAVDPSTIRDVQPPAVTS